MFPTELKQMFDSANFYAAAPFRDIFDVEKARVLRSIHPHTSLSWRALSAIYDAACTIERERIPGDLAAGGASAGGAAALAASVFETNRARQTWVFGTQRPVEDLFRRLYLNPRGKNFVK